MGRKKNWRQKDKSTNNKILIKELSAYSQLHELKEERGLANADPTSISVEVKIEHKRRIQLPRCKPK